MAEILFTYKGIPISILCKKEEIMKDIFKKFATKINSNENNFYFLYGGKQINEQLTFNQQAKKIDLERKQMNILVYDKNNNTNIINEKIKSKEIICPKCWKNCRISFINYKIKLYDCENNHIIEDLFLNEFNNSQVIDESNIICDNCKKNNKKDSYQNKFYICLTCGNKLCLLCNTIHDKNHKIIDYNKQNYICPKHNDLFYIVINAKLIYV